MSRHCTTRRSRSKPSAPLRWLLKNGHVTNTKTVLDYGCGHGRDVVHMLELFGADSFVAGYDPFVSPDSMLTSNTVDDAFIAEQLRVRPALWDTVLLTYVVNVMPFEAQKRLMSEVLPLIEWGGGELYVTVRRDVWRDGPVGHGYQCDVRFAELMNEVALPWAQWRSIRHVKSRFEIFLVDRKKKHQLA